MDDIKTIKENNENKEYILKIVKEKGSYLEWASKELQNDKEVVMEAVKQDGGALEFASDASIRESGMGCMLCK